MPDRGKSDSARERVAEDGLYRATLEAAVDGILTIDSRGHIQAVNPAGCALFATMRTSFSKKMSDS